MNVSATLAMAMQLVTTQLDLSCVLVILVFPVMDLIAQVCKAKHGRIYFSAYMGQLASPRKGNWGHNPFGKIFVFNLT